MGTNIHKTLTDGFGNSFSLPSLGQQKSRGKTHPLSLEVCDSVIYDILGMKRADGSILNELLPWVYNSFVNRRKKLIESLGL